MLSLSPTKPLELIKRRESNVSIGEVYSIKQKNGRQLEIGVSQVFSPLRSDESTPLSKGITFKENIKDVGLGLAAEGVTGLGRRLTVSHQSS